MDIPRLFPVVRPDRQRQRLHAGATGKLPLTRHEAAFVRRLLRAGNNARCPRCGDALMNPVTIRRGRPHWIVTCPTCVSTHRLPIESQRPAAERVPAPRIALPKRPMGARGLAATVAIAAHFLTFTALGAPRPKNVAPPISRYADTTYMVLAPLTAPANTHASHAAADPLPRRGASAPSNGHLPQAIAPRNVVSIARLGLTTIRQPSLRDAGRARQRDTSGVVARHTVQPVPEEHRPDRDPAGILYLEDAVDERPERISGPRPTYPLVLRRANIEGSVLLRFVIDTDGQAEPSSLTVLSATRIEFMKAAVEAVQQTRYQPGRIRGEAVRVQVEQEFKFGS